MSTPPMISNRAIGIIRRHQRALFAAGLAMADPNVSLVLSRRVANTNTWVAIDPQTVLVRWQGDRGMRGLGEGALTTSISTSPTPLDGMFQAVVPFDVMTGDRFLLDGLKGRIGRVWPERNGRQRAGFIIDVDNRAAL